MASHDRDSNPPDTKVEYVMFFNHSPVIDLLIPSCRRIVLIGSEWKEDTILHLRKDNKNASIFRSAVAFHTDQVTQANIGFHAGSLAASLVSQLPTVRKQ